MLIAQKKCFFVSPLRYPSQSFKFLTFRGFSAMADFPMTALMANIVTIKWNIKRKEVFYDEKGERDEINRFNLTYWNLII